jgi:hypothetical protein
MKPVRLRGMAKRNQARGLSGLVVKGERAGQQSLRGGGLASIYRFVKR